MSVAGLALQFPGLVLLSRGSKALSILQLSQTPVLNPHFHFFFFNALNSPGSGELSLGSL